MSASSRPPRDGTIGLALGLALAALYLATPGRPLLDSKYALLTSESLLLRQSWDLSPYLPEWSCPAAAADPEMRRRAWQLQCAEARLIFAFPPGTPLLSLPAVALLRAAGLSSIRADGLYSQSGERRQQAWLAALVTAATAGLVFAAARRELSPAGAAAVAAATGLGSSLFSLASRALWSHSWAALISAAVLIELLRWEEGRRRRPALLGALLAAAFWVRPTSVVLIAASVLLVAWRHRAGLGRVLATGLAGAAAFALWSIAAVGHLSPSVTRRPIGGFSFTHATGALAGLLFSPLVGLLVFTPALLAIAIVLLRGPVPGERRPLVIWAAAIATGYCALYSPWPAWWGGGPVGPRFFTELSPLFGWLAAVAWRTAGARGRATALRAALAGLAVAGIAAHAAVAMPIAGSWSRARPDLSLFRFDGQTPRVLWSWSESPYAALWRAARGERSGGVRPSPRSEPAEDG